MGNTFFVNGDNYTKQKKKKIVLFPIKAFNVIIFIDIDVGKHIAVLVKGEYGGDNSNNGSNKGIYDNDMNLYQPLADAYARVDKHIMGLVNYFDALHGGN